MKKFNLIMAIAMLTFGAYHSLKAQTKTGLYFTYNDYVNHKISYSGDKINIHGFIASNNVSVTSNNKKNKIAKSIIFGYHDNNNIDYRFCNNLAYRIVDTASFYMYSCDRLAQQGKNLKPFKAYYFSATPNSEILLLTPENIARVFPHNHKFYNTVEMEYKSNIKLDAYDNSANEYKIKELYAESLK